MKTIACFSVWVMLASGFVKGDEVTDWNHIMLTAMLTPPVTPTPVATRTAAIFQSAVFDAANGVDPRYKPIYVPPGNAVTDWSAIASTTIVKMEESRRAPPRFGAPIRAWPFMTP